MTQKPPRQFTLKDQAPAAIAYGSACRQKGRSCDPVNLTSGLKGEVLPEGGCEPNDAAREWLRLVETGRIGGA
jgi:hypothetical protein